MSTPRTSTCLFCSFMRASRPTKPQLRRSLHSSPARLVRKPRFPNVKADLAPIELHHGRKLDEASRERLKKTYSQQQMIAIEAADKVIDPSELKDTTLRNDPWSLKYYDDLSQVDPIVDKQPQEPWSSIDGSMRLKTADEFDDDFAKFLANFPSDPKEQDTAWDSFEKNLRMTVGREESERNPRSARVLTFSDIPRPPEKDTRSRKPNDKANDTTEHSPELLRLMQMTGYTARQIAQLCVKTVVTHRVVNQTRLGKIQKMYYLTVAGNGNGLIGIGEGKAEDVSSAALQSQYRAIRNMQPILRYENRTIFGDVAGKVGATELELYARPPGFGLRCQQYVWEICKCAGISDLAARVTRARNPMNTVKATIQALLSQKDPEDIARARGKKLVDVRRVYYAGMV